jgi:hypothetical protein
MHCATGVPVGQARHLQRVSIAGDPSMGRIEAADIRSAARVMV